MVGYLLKKKSSGFTIIELIIVIAVIGILAAIGIIAYGGVTQSARDKTVLSDSDGVEAELARYSTKNNGTYGTVLNWYSPGAANANITFTPSQGNIVDVVATTTDYCIRVYNTSSGSYKTIATAVKKGSTSTACSTIAASAQAIVDSP